MSTDSQEEPRIGRIEADAISVWACDREGRGDGTPILIAVRVWELASLRGIHILDVWSPHPPPSKSEEAEDLRIDLEWWRNEETGSQQFAELVHSGHLRYIGKMPEMPGYPPESLHMTREQRAATPAE